MASRRHSDMRSYSQFGEDVFILRRLPLPTKGTFVEVGAYDGLASSNTKGFEEEGWNGLCIEADPLIAQACRRNRNCLVLSSGIGSRPGRQTFWVNPNDRGTSSLKPHLGWTPTTIEVRPLLDVLKNLALTQIDLLSIDTEGTELDVWDSIGPIRPPIVIMEFWTQPDAPRDKEIVDRMNRDGYEEVHRTEANLIFYRV